MKKTYCDICEKELGKKEIYHVIGVSVASGNGNWNGVRPHYEDACDMCMLTIIGAINSAVSDRKPNGDK